MRRRTFCLAISLFVCVGTEAGFASRAGALSSKTSAVPVRKSLIVDEVKLWKNEQLLQQVAKKLNPLGLPPGDGALGLNRRFPEKVLVDHQLTGWNWIRSGVALGNGFIVDRGIMAFEWAFARMQDSGASEGSFGESKTIEISNFLGLYARSVLLLRYAKMEDRAKRLERLIPRLEASLRSPHSLLGERRWDSAERKMWVTSQRLQAAAAAYWIGRLLANPGLRKTADLWLDEGLKRQEASGLFPISSDPSNSKTSPQSAKASVRGQLDALEALQGLAWADATYGVKLREPIAKGFKWIEASRVPVTGSPITFATYAAWTKNPYAAKITQTALKRAAAQNLRSDSLTK